MDQKWVFGEETAHGGWRLAGSSTCVVHVRGLEGQDCHLIVGWKSRGIKIRYRVEQA